MSIFYQERENSLQTLVLFVILFFFVVINYSFVFGEGSQNYNANGTGHRDFITYRNGDPFYDRPTTHFVYLKTGEKMYIGTAVYQNATREVTVKNPSGEISSYNVDKNGVGFITNRTQELSGPNTISANGYNPITYTANTEGIYQVDFFGNDNYENGSSCLLLVEENWDIDADCVHASIAAWDITVVNSSGNKVNGRVFYRVMAYTQALLRQDDRLEYGVTSSSFYVLTNNGYQYRIDLNGIHPISYSISANNIGNTINGRAAYSSYLSIPEKIDEGWNIFEGSDFEENSQGQVAYRIFYNKPNSELLTYLGLPANGTPIIPKIKNFKYISDASDDINTSVKGFGGVFQFDCEDAQGKYRFTLEFEDNEIIIDRKLDSTNTFVWDGKDNSGNIVDTGTFTAKIETLPGEFHLVLNDVEMMENGIKVQHLNGESAGSYSVRYNHTPRSLDGVWNGMDHTNITAENNVDFVITDFDFVNGWIVNADDNAIQYLKGALDQSAGIDSSNGASNTKYFYSDRKAFDFWVFDGDEQTIEINVTVLPETKSVKVAKLWDDDNDRELYRPDRIQFNLFCGSTECGNNPYTITENDGWTITVPDIPIYDENGQKYTYSVTEIGIN